MPPHPPHPANEPAPEPPSVHTQREARSRQLLESARTNAAKAHEYCTADCRKSLVDSFAAACGGKKPYDWQINVSEALLLGLDVVLTAGTGAGKSMPFVMPLLLKKSEKKMVIILSPLNELERDQARRFNQMGLPAAAVNGEDYDTKLHEGIAAKAFRVIVTSPEMCLNHPRFSSLMHAPKFMCDVMYIVVDEAHCISQWGDSFRKDYARLVQLRSLLGIRKPFLLASATFPPFILIDTLLKLEFRESTTYFVNIGNDRPNITPIVHVMKAAQSSLPIIDFLVRDALPGSTLPRVIIFFNTRELAFKAYRHLQNCVGESLHVQINFLHAGRGQRARRRVMRLFCEGTINILCATEAAGMGMDIPDIDMVIQFLIANSLSVWMQRAGRAGRSGTQAYAVILIEPAVFQPKPAPKPHALPSGAASTNAQAGRQKAIKTKAAKTQNPTGSREQTTTPASRSNASGRPAATVEVKRELIEAEEGITEASAATTKTTEAGVGAGSVARAEILGVTAVLAGSAQQGVTGGQPVVEYKKHTEEGMRLWAAALLCRRFFADIYFGNPPRPVLHARFPCCDNCVLAKKAAGKALSSAEQAVVELIAQITTGSDVGQDETEDNDEDAVKCEDLDANLNKTFAPADAPYRIVAMRRDQHLADCRACLYRWRMKCWVDNYTYCSFTPQILLPDVVLTRLATWGRLQQVSDIREKIPSWVFTDVHGAEVLGLLAEIDLRYHTIAEERKVLEKEARTKRAAETKEARNEERRTRRRLEHQEKALLPGGVQVLPSTNIDVPQQYIFEAVVFTPVHPSDAPGPSQPSSSYSRPVQFC